MAARRTRYFTWRETARGLWLRWRARWLSRLDAERATDPENEPRNRSRLQEAGQERLDLIERRCEGDCNDLLGRHDRLVDSYFAASEREERTEGERTAAVKLVETSATQFNETVEQRGYEKKVLSKVWLRTATGGAALAEFFLNAIAFELLSEDFQVLRLFLAALFTAILLALSHYLGTLMEERPPRRSRIRLTIGGLIFIIAILSYLRYISLEDAFSFVNAALTRTQTAGMFAVVQVVISATTASLKVATTDSDRKELDEATAAARVLDQSAARLARELQRIAVQLDSLHRKAAVLYDDCLLAGTKWRNVYQRVDQTYCERYRLTRRRSAGPKWVAPDWLDDLQSLVDREFVAERPEWIGELSCSHIDVLPEPATT